MDKENSLKLENQLCFQLYTAARLSTRLYHQLLNDLDITYPQYLVFLVLWEHSPRKVSDISDALLLESSTLTPLLKRLEDKGLVKRERQKTDERVVEISLTEEGQNLREKAICIPSELIKNLKTENISLEEFLKLKDILQKLNVHLTDLK